ncbi:dephospho-CoA kinase [Psychroflexus salis]|uniref:Dephospho-CoA kinase n=1 Tax=Psychroflexus salis TaxID=1526574 RepID=A0A917EBP5_9FLAO|nr:dephospho-CoA kinase [Psychroflexus salis]GGE21701.1 dephospho-CoA kinase [Psychroflexus salis]
MITLAITGGIGSGKTTVVNYFKSLGCPVFIADIEAKKLMNTSKNLKQAIVKSFGEQTYLNGKLNKAYLSEQVFSKPEKLNLLNQLVHPVVANAFSEWKTKQTSPLLIYEAAIIFEKNKQNQFDYTALVTAPKDEKIERIQKRDNTSYAQIEARMQHQWDDNRKKKLADFIINNEELIKTEQKVQEIYKYLKNIHNF